MFPAQPPPADAQSALQRVRAFASRVPGFSWHWDASVRQVADMATAWVAGQRMAGREPDSEVIPGTSGPLVPGPPGMPPGDVLAAFTLAVESEVRARLDAMTSPGSLG